MVIQNGYHIMLENHREDGGEFTYALNHLGTGHGFVVGLVLKSLLFKHGTVECRSLCVTAS